MTTSKEKLIKIYQEAKKRRIVLKQAEFAKAVGLSRVHLFNKMEEIPKSVLDKAEKLLETNNVSNNTNNVINPKAPLDPELNRLIELSIKHGAALEVLQLLVESILAVQRGTSIALVSEEVQTAIKMRADRRFDEYSKKK